MNSDRDTLRGGLPHSEIPGSPIARISPGLFAACHVLHRLSVPRHPPDALLLRLDYLPCRPRTGARPPLDYRPRQAASHEDTSRISCTPDRSPGAGPIRLGHMTNSRFTLQTTRVAAARGAIAFFFAKRRWWR